jgi:hypothetical protein
MASGLWGVVLAGEPSDLEVWREALKPPVDPWVLETNHGLILRSRPLDNAATKSEARERADALMDEVNGAIRASMERGPSGLNASRKSSPTGPSDGIFPFWRIRVNFGEEGAPPFLVRSSPANPNGGCRSRQTTALSPTR